ncbi:hypothetical protein BT96DRAFT_984199 [Gymnopus androsaceus JB14]|uniref:Uncharacterized protein n=1 Tax=Gymnopus androsaceus JB14 TaxID=1447944 RepID=A0A6A4IN53_9AGAR|nr:hypothetical protein BT96DRAFT_984199 [Gymnopus androsaceus JB14]
MPPEQPPTKRRRMDWSKETPTEPVRDVLKGVSDSKLLELISLFENPDERDAVEQACLDAIEKSELGKLDVSEEPLCFLPPSFHQRTAKIAHGAITVYGTAVGSDSQANNIRVLEPIILELLKLFGGEVTYDEVEYEENKELEIGASEVEPRSVCKEFRTRFGAIFHLIVIEVKDRINMASFAQLFAEMTGKTFSTHVVGFCSLVFLLAMCTANAKAGNEEFEVYGILVDQSISFYFTVDSRELAQRDEERKAASVTASSAAPSNAAPSPPSTTTYSTYPFKYGGSIPLPIGPPLPNFFTQTIHCEFLLFLVCSSV